MNAGDIRLRGCSVVRQPNFSIRVGRMRGVDGGSVRLLTVAGKRIRRDVGGKCASMPGLICAGMGLRWNRVCGHGCSAARNRIVGVTHGTAAWSRVAYPHGLEVGGGVIRERDWRD